MKAHESECHRGELPLVVVVGQTATGKTALAVELAQRLDGEVISADSRQVYRGMDIGTAKPTPEEQRLAPHHLIDIVAPNEPFGLAQYLDLAHEAVAGIRARGRIPILAGGTAQYVWALVEGWQVPRVEPRPELRAALEQRGRVDGGLSLHRELAARDPTAAAEIHPHNMRRVIRALELLETTGQLPSTLRARRSPRVDARIIGLALPREELYARIDRRVEAMFAGGLLDEVRRLLAAGYDPSLPALSSMGYAQAVQYLRGEIDLLSAIVQAQTATHRLARQQATWFRGDDSRINWQRPEEVEAAVAVVMAGCSTR